MYAYLMPVAAVSHAPMQSGTDVCLSRAPQRMNLIRDLSVVLSEYEADEDVTK